MIGVTSTPKGGGYWLPATTGALSSFGNAPFLGSGAPNFASSL